jgi:hypothetical protein
MSDRWKGIPAVSPADDAIDPVAAFAADVHRRSGGTIRGEWVEARVRELIAAERERIAEGIETTWNGVECAPLGTDCMCVVMERAFNAATRIVLDGGLP